MWGSVELFNSAAAEASVRYPDGLTDPVAEKVNQTGKG
jgi:hypothetical protein